MPLPAGVETVTVSSGEPLALPDGTWMQGRLTFTGPDLVTIGEDDVILGGTVEVPLVDGEFSVVLCATDATGMSPTGWTYTVTAVLTNAPDWVRYISLPKATASVKLADVIVPDPVAGTYSTLIEQSVADARYVRAVNWRRRDLPDPALADSLYTGTAPGISTAQTTTPQTGFVKYAPAGVALSGTDVTGPYQYAGAGSFAIGSVSPDTNYVLPLSKYPNTYASGQGTWSVEFGTDAQVMQVRMKYISASTMFRLSVDGRKVTDLMQSSGGITPGSGHLITIDLGSSAPRRIRLDFSTFPFGGIYIAPTAAMWSVPLTGGRLAVLGDSISDGSAGNTGAGCGTWVDRVGRLLGCTDVWRQGRGGTGYITAGSFAVFQDRLALDITLYAPDRLIIWGGYNDSAGSQASIATAASLLFSTVATALPNCQITVIGCWSPTGSPSSGQTNTTATLKTAAAAAGLPFISPQDGALYNAAGALVATHGAWITGTGRVGATTGVGNADTWIYSDAVHPTDTGHIGLARRIAAALTELMPA